LLCEEMDAILTRWSSALSEWINYTLASNGQDFATHCKTLATRRYEQEVKYVRTLMVEKGVTHLVRNLRAYSLNYLIGNRMNDLADKYNELEGCYSSVLRYTTNTACCNE
jgi:hypothetical protein